MSILDIELGEDFAVASRTPRRDVADAGVARVSGSVSARRPARPPAARASAAPRLQGQHRRPLAPTERRAALPPLREKLVQVSPSCVHVFVCLFVVVFWL